MQILKSTQDTSVFLTNRSALLNLAWVFLSNIFKKKSDGFQTTGNTKRICKQLLQLTQQIMAKNVKFKVFFFSPCCFLEQDFV